jgi:hypothetical protein
LAHAAENAHRFDEAIGFFARPRYELLATGEVVDGASPLGGLMQENVTAFPDFHYDFTHLHHSDNAIVVEGSFRGTHEGRRRGCRRPGVAWTFDPDRVTVSALRRRLDDHAASSGAPLIGRHR